MPNFDLSQHAELARWIEEGTEEAAKEGLHSAAQRLVGIIQNEIIPAEKPPPVFDRHYAAGWHAEKTERGADVYNDMPYALVIERGARAGNIKIGRRMIEALTEWARRKGLTGHPIGKRASPEAGADARRIAWAIARVMQGIPGKRDGAGIFNRDGQEGLRIAEKAAKRLPEFVEEEVQDAVRRRMR